MSIFKKSSEVISRTNPGFEETERHTPRAGVVLLFAMFIAGMYFGWRVIDDISRIPAVPDPLSSCSYNYRNDNYLLMDQRTALEVGPKAAPIGDYSYNYDSFTECQYNAIEKKYSIPEIYKGHQDLAGQITGVAKNRDEVYQSLSSVRSQIQRLTQEYGTGLQEQQNNVTNPVFPTAPTARSLTDLRQQEASLLKQQRVLDKQYQDLNNQIRELDKKIAVNYQPVFAEQDILLRWYEFKVFLLGMLFVFPFFLLVLWGYWRLMKKNSPYTVILTTMVAVASALMLRLILEWFWGLFLARVIEVITRWIHQYQIISTLVFYSGMLLSFAVFGGTVYFLQKRIFDPRRVTIRRFRAKQCPHCQTNLDLAVNYCPNCGAQIKEKCTNCGNMRFKGLPACPVCGDKTAQ